HHPLLPPFPTRRSSDLLQAFQLFLDLRRTIDVELVCLDAPGPHRHLTQEPGVVVAGPLVFPKGIRTLSQALRATRRRGDVFHALDRKSTRLNSSHDQIS